MEHRHGATGSTQGRSRRYAEMSGCFPVASRSGSCSSRVTARSGPGKSAISACRRSAFRHHIGFERTSETASATSCGVVVIGSRRMDDRSATMEITIRLMSSAMVAW